MWKLSETVNDEKAMILYIYYAHLEEIKTKQTSFSHPPIQKPRKEWLFASEARGMMKGSDAIVPHSAGLLGKGGQLEQDSGWDSPWALLEAKAVRATLPSAPQLPLSGQQGGWLLCPFTRVPSPGPPSDSLLPARGLFPGPGSFWACVQSS